MRKSIKSELKENTFVSVASYNLDQMVDVFHPQFLNRFILVRFIR